MEMDEEKPTEPAGEKCKQCGTVSEFFCDKCNECICENHMVKTDNEGGCICTDCSENE